MIVKVGSSDIRLGLFSEGARRCAVGDELRKTPCTRSCDGKSSQVSDRSSSLVAGVNHQGGRGCRPETTSRGYDRLDDAFWRLIRAWRTGVVPWSQLH